MGLYNKKNNGFTLIEIMIALFIFAIVAAIAAGSFHTLLSARTRIRKNAEYLGELQLALTLVGRDVQQVVNRSILDEKGKRQPALVSKKNYVEFTHGGIVNPLATERRSTLQRVAYLLKKTDLIRRSWPVLDRVQQTKPSDKIILSDVKKMQISYLEETKWEKTSQNSIPRAIKISITLPKWGKIIRIWQIRNNMALP